MQELKVNRMRASSKMKSDIINGYIYPTVFLVATLIVANCIFLKVHKAYASKGVFSFDYLYYRGYIGSPSSESLIFYRCFQFLILLLLFRILAHSRLWLAYAFIAIACIFWFIPMKFNLAL